MKCQWPSKAVEPSNITITLSVSYVQSTIVLNIKLNAPYAAQCNTCRHVGWLWGFGFDFS